VPKPDYVFAGINEGETENNNRNMTGDYLHGLAFVFVMYP
jgi:hypothetical protein